MRGLLEGGPWKNQIADMDGALNSCQFDEVVVETFVVTEKLSEAAT